MPIECVCKMSSTCTISTACKLNRYIFKTDRYFHAALRVVRHNNGSDTINSVMIAALGTNRKTIRRLLSTNKSKIFRFAMPHDEIKLSLLWSISICARTL